MPMPKSLAEEWIEFRTHVLSHVTDDEQYMLRLKSIFYAGCLTVFRGAMGIAQDDVSEDDAERWMQATTDELIGFSAEMRERIVTEASKSKAVES